jgi:hypothetical protein
LAGLNSLICRIRHVRHQRVVGDQRLALPVLVLGLEIELDDQLREQLPLRESADGA